MALMAHLKFGSNVFERYEKDYLLLSVKCKLSRDYNGIRPSTSFHRIVFTVDAIVPDSGDLGLYGWYIDEECRTGCVVMEEQSIKNDVSRRIVKFEDARCCGFSERFDITQKWRRQMRIQFSATQVEVEGMTVTC